jgi:hypothetical protein
VNCEGARWERKLEMLKIRFPMQIPSWKKKISCANAPRAKVFCLVLTLQKVFSLIGQKTEEVSLLLREGSLLSFKFLCLCIRNVLLLGLHDLVK